MHPVVQPSVVSLFAGIGGFDLGFARAGCRIVATVEIDKNCRRLLSARWPDAVHLDDVRTAGRHNLPECDIVTFGFPCQDLSVAGKRAGLEGKRSGLFYEAMRIIDELNPAWAVWENVPGLLSSDNGRDLARVLFRLGESGYFGCVRCIDAQWLGVAQRRRRLFGVFTRLDSGVERCAEILSIAESLRGHPAPSREAGKGFTHDVAPCIGASGRGFERCGETRGQDPVVACHTTGAGYWQEGMGTLRAREQDSHENVVVTGVPDICGCLSDGAHNGGGLNGQDAYSGRIIPVCASGDVAHSLRGEGFDASEDGTGRDTPLVATYDMRGRGNGAVVNTLCTDHASRPKQGDPCHPLASGAHPPCVAIQDVRGLDKKQNGRGHNCDGTAYTVDAMATQGVCVPDVAGTMPSRASGVGGGPGAGTDEAAAGYLIPTVAGTLKSCGGKTGGWSNSADHAAAGYMIPAVAGCLQERDAHAAMQVRRLTPREAERLQGFQWRCSPTDHEAWQDELGRWWSPDYTADFSDSVRYRMLGNAVCVNVAEWIAKRLVKEVRRD